MYPSLSDLTLVHFGSQSTHLSQYHDCTPSSSSVNQNLTPCCRRDDLRRLHKPHRGSHQQSNISCQQTSHSSRAILIPIV